MQNPWWKQLLIGLALFLAGYFMFGGKLPTNDESKQETKQETKPTSSIVVKNFTA